MKTLTALLFLLFSSSVASEPGLWFNPERNGHGLLVTEDMGDGHAVIWFLYGRDGSSAFLISTENCTAFPCVVPLVDPVASFMGGDLDLGLDAGTIEMRKEADTLHIRYDLREWYPDFCSDISPGGIIFRQCAGSQELVLLAK